MNEKVSASHETRSKDNLIFCYSICSCPVLSVLYCLFILTISFILFHSQQWNKVKEKVLQAIVDSILKYCRSDSTASKCNVKQENQRKR